jgi:lipopolysaccharide export system protein LptA
MKQHDYRITGRAAPASLGILAAMAAAIAFLAPAAIAAQTSPPKAPAQQSQPAQPQAAQPAPAQAPAAGTAAGSSDTITFSARRMESVIAKGKEKTILIGQAVVNTGTVQIKADRIELSGEDYNDVTCAGAVVVFDESKGFLLKSATLKYARDTEIGLAQDKVVIEDSKNDVVLKAEWVRFDQKQSLVDARIAVHILKEDFAVRAEFARYNRDDESLQLSGSPVAVSPDGTISADTISGTPSMEGLELGGSVSGTISTKKKEGTSP